MGFRKGCLKPGCLGCLGLLVIGLLVGGITAMMAWRGLDEGEIAEQELTARAGRPVAVGDEWCEDGLETDWSVIPPGSGRVHLELGEGEFIIRPASPGERVHVRARFDSEVHELVDHFEAGPDSNWVYRVRFHRTMPGLQALFRAIMGGDTDASIRIYLPPDVPIALLVDAQQGGMEAELGGTWITDADIRFAKGGCALNFDEPLREPMGTLNIRGRMGGFDVQGLGDASPHILNVDCAMGGANIDLRGDWARDCDIRLAIRMGGMAVTVPRDLDIRGLAAVETRLDRDEPEIPAPVLRFDVSESMGEIDVTTAR